MKELVINGKYYPMWSGVIDKKTQWKKIINIDGGKVAEATLHDIRLEPNGDDSAVVMFDVTYEGKRTEWGADVGTIGVTGNNTGHQGLCFHTQHAGVFVLQRKGEV